MFSLVGPIYPVNMISLRLHLGSHICRPRFDLWPHLFDPWGKNSKFRLLTFLHMPILHIPTKRYWNLTNSLGGVRESTKNRSILSNYLTPVTLTLVRRFWTFHPDTPLSKAHIPCEYCENPTMGNGWKGCPRRTAGRPDGRPDGRTDGQTDGRLMVFIYLPSGR